MKDSNSLRQLLEQQQVIQERWEKGASLILCVDAEQAGRCIRELIPEHSGFSVLSARTPEDALALFESHTVDLVVTNDSLGRTTRARMIGSLKLLKPEVPIVVLSGAPDLVEDLQHVDEFISEGDGPEHLLEVMRETLSKTGQSRGSIPVPRRDFHTLQSLFAAIVENSDDAILSKTLDGTILSWNRAAEKMYGYSAQEIVGKSIATLLPADRPNEIHEILNRLKKGEKIDHFEATRITKDGQLLCVSLTISPICDLSGNIVGASTIARDITQLKMAEQSLRNSERLALAGRMAATIAHEINNPLDALGDTLYLIEKSVPLNQAGALLIGMARDQLKRVSDISHTTLSLTREGKPEPATLELAELLENVLALYGRSIQSLGITVEKRFESSGRVVGVSGELRQIFSNLIVNAMDALTGAGNRLVVHIYDSIDWRDFSRRGVRVAVLDNASGINPETRAHLFEPFFSTKGEKGTGVGLWLSRGMVEKHGGSIRLHTSTCGGSSYTCFMVFLPFPGFLPTRHIG